VNKKYLFIFTIVIVIFAAFFLLTKKPQQKNTDILINGKKLQVELMQTEEEKTKGLSDRKNLCSNCGLLFVYNQEGFYSFWMRKMYFDIDILWINKDRVVDITYDAKKPEVDEFESPRTIYQNKVPADKVLEVNAGWVEKNGIKVGETIVFK